MSRREFERNIRTAECKGELKKGYSCAATGAKTAIHDPDVGIRAAELCVCDDEADSPIRDEAKHY
jgi:hypothetical protein